MTNLDDQKKIALLQEYAETLERENFAKNGETTLLYQQLRSLRQQNEMLKFFIETIKNKWESQKRELTEQLHSRQVEQITNSRNYGDELRNSVDMHSLKAVAQDMKAQLQQKQKQVSQLTQERYQLQEQVLRLREQLTQATCKTAKTEEKLRSQMQVIKQLENQIFGLRNSRYQSKAGVSFAKLQADKLIKQNNELIQKIRVLEKEKNGYYNQLKMTSPLKSRATNHQNKSAQKRSQCISTNAHGKSERWNLMQQKLRAIRNENQQLKANLAIH